MGVTCPLGFGQMCPFGVIRAPRAYLPIIEVNIGAYWSKELSQASAFSWGTPPPVLQFTDVSRCARVRVKQSDERAKLGRKKKTKCWLFSAFIKNSFCSLTPRLYFALTRQRYSNYIATWALHLLRISYLIFLQTPYLLRINTYYKTQAPHTQRFVSESAGRGEL